MGRLARFRGHFYNWYDTRDLRPLDPPYVSTVDSGNLAGHLITLGQRLPANGPSWRPRPRGACPASPTRSISPVKRPTGCVTGGAR